MLACIVIGAVAGVSFLVLAVIACWMLFLGTMCFFFGDSGSCPTSSVWLALGLRLLASSVVVAGAVWLWPNTPMPPLRNHSAPSPPADATDDAEQTPANQLTPDAPTGAG